VPLISPNKIMAPSIDEFEDLTQFADESFDTEEVDLFEFTDDEDSPLLRLKSIVLSLDWDITEEILTELNDELANLRSMWKDDKVAQIYLQGMENVGRYMQAEGAYAHPNAIKLLLTLYHNYEKIISSPNISGDSITAMLKADIRKFKVLQYQISALKKTQGSHDAAEAAPEEIEEGTATTPAATQKQKEAAAAMPPPLRSMEATILGLEWEVTDEGLEKFNTEATQLRSYLSGNTEGQVLIQGLQALGAYIREQKSNAHPDSFTILHSFYDALKMLLESPELGAEQRRQILVEQISSLNSLKEVIARSGASKTAEAEEEVPEQLEEEPDTAADEEEDVLADDFGSPDEELGGSPALADEDGMNFDFAFDDDEAETKPQKSSAPAAAVLPEKPVPSKVAAVVTAKPATIAADDEDEFDDDLFSDSGGVTPALADEDEEGGFSDSFASTGLGGERAAELDEKLDSFFNFGDNEEEKPKAEAPKPKVAASVSPAEPQKPQKQSLATILDEIPEEDDEDEDDTLDSSFFNFDDELENVASTKLSARDDDDTLSFDDELGDDFDSKAEKTSAKNPIAAVLTDSDEEQRLSTVGDSLDDEDEGDDELDSFFNFDDEIERTDTPQNAISSIAVEEQHGDTLNVDDDMFNEQKKETDRPLVTAALIDEDEAEDALAVDDDTLSSGLDSFFSFDDEDDEGLKTQSTAALAGGNADISLDDDDDMFNEQKEETAKPSVTAALTDEDEAEKSSAVVDDDTLSSGLDSFFSFDDEADEGLKTDSTTAALAGGNADISLDVDDDMFNEQKEETAKPSVVTAALTDEDEAEDSSATNFAVDEVEEHGLGSGFDSFFSFDDGDAPKTAAVAVEENEDSLSFDDNMFGLQDEKDTLIAPALVDENEESASSVNEEDDVAELRFDNDIFGEQDEIADEESSVEAAFADEEKVSLSTDRDAPGDDGLDSFFNSFDDEVKESLKTESATITAVSDLNDDDDKGFAAAGIDVERAAEIKNKLDSLFNFDDEPAVKETAVEGTQADEDTDTPELDDEFITALDEEPAQKEEEMFSTSEFAVIEEEAVADTDDDGLFGLNQDEESADSQNTDQDDDDAFFAFDSSSGPDKEEGAELSKDEEPATLSSDSNDEENDNQDFFHFAAEGEKTAFTEEDSADANDDGLFGLAQNEESADNQDTDTAQEDDDTFFAFDSSSGPDKEEAELSKDEVSVTLSSDSNDEESGDQDFFRFAAEGEDDASEEEATFASDDDGLFGLDEPAEENSILAENQENNEASFTFETDSNVEKDTWEEADVSAVLPGEDSDDLLLGEEYETESEPAALFGQDEMQDPFRFNANESTIKEIEPDNIDEEELITTENSGESAAEVISSLTAVAVALTAVPSAHHLRQISELAVAAQKENSLPPHQSIVLNLIDSSVIMLAKAPHGTVVSSAIVKELVAALNKAETPAMLANMISRYTAWQRDFFEQILLSKEQQKVALPKESSPEDAGLRLVQEKFSQLKLEMMEEFNRLRQEMIGRH
jgi:pilus assembly protein FimV